MPIVARDRHVDRVYADAPVLKPERLRLAVEHMTPLRQHSTVPTTPWIAFLFGMAAGALVTAGAAICFLHF
jgi:uncharacterized membrane protein